MFYCTLDTEPGLPRCIMPAKKKTNFLVNRMMLLRFTLANYEQAVNS